MPVSDHIQRLSIDPDGLDFEALRKEAIGKVQDLCGTIWTDYNLHDPGVTILEQLCYGLTDLSYRSGFPVEDYLAGEKNKIGYHRHGLHTPEEIFPSAAVTEIDYQKILYDAIPEIDYVWLEPCDAKGGAGIKGLYTLFVKLDAELIGELIESRTVRAKSGMGLRPLSAELVRIRLASSQLYAQLDKLGQQLDGESELLQSGRDSAAYAGFSGSDVIRYSEQVSQCLEQLDSILRYIDAIWQQIDTLWSIIADSATGDGLALRLAETLFKLDAIFNYARLRELLNDTLTTTESSSKDWAPVGMEMLERLSILATRFERALIKLTDMLLRIGNGLTSSVGSTGQSSAKYDERIIKQEILHTFVQHRGLCEDIHRIEIIQTNSYFLAGQVEIKPSYSRAKIFAEIFFKCARAISSGIQIERYEPVFKQTGDYEQIFSGPLTQHGYIADRCFEVNQTVLNIVDLINLINNIEGVVQVCELYLLDQENKKHTAITYDSCRYAFPVLSFPKTGKPKQVLRLVISQNAGRKDSEGKESDFFSFDAVQDESFLAEAHLELRRLIFEYHAFRKNRLDFAQLIRLPEGQRRDFADYYSIQHHFPAIYGINRYGIPQSESPEVKAKAKQLKAYLFPYEQLMADFLQNLNEIPTLFSIDPMLRQTYFSQFLTNRNIPDIESLYVSDEEENQQLLDEIRTHHDRFADRRNRVLDTLLALYGETYPQWLLLQFDCYRRTDPSEWIIENKIHYLKCIREITRDRAAGFDYLVQGTGEGRSIAGAQKRISLLLGLAQFERAAMITDVLIKRNSRLIPDHILAQRMRFLSKDLEEAAMSLPPEEDRGVKTAIPETLPDFGYAVFRAGVDLKNYRIVDSGRGTVVCLQTEYNGRYWPLGAKRDKAEAVRYAYDFCDTLTQLNIACENFHLVEHILLRPRGANTCENLSDPAAFFDFRVSVIFPAWTARFADSAFRKFAEEIVVKNLPAHIFPEFYWLDFVYMQDFEHRHKKWRDCLSRIGTDDTPEYFEQLNDAAEKLVDFLFKNRQTAGSEYWI